MSLFQHMFASLTNSGREASPPPLGRSFSQSNTPSGFASRSTAHAVSPSTTAKVDDGWGVAVNALLLIVACAVLVWLAVKPRPVEPKVFLRVSDSHCVFVYSPDPEHSCTNRPKHARTIYLE